MTIKFKKKIKNIIMIILIIVFFIWSGYLYIYYFDVLKDPVKIKRIISSWGNYSILAFLLLQIVQVVAFFIPGEVIQIASGFIYGTVLGGALSIVGITIGSFICYYFANKYGKPFVESIISKKQIKLFNKVLKYKNLNIIVLLLYAIPGIPKDALAYICGISNISLREFLIYSTIGRIPGIYISAYFGAELFKGDIKKLIFIAVSMSILFIIGVINAEKILNSIVKKVKNKT